MSPSVHFHPIDEQIECGEDETVLDAAFRNGYSLVYGCREGQCSACKCYLLEGEVSLKPFSTFALTEAEEEQGYTLLCRAMPDSDLDVELLHFDPDNYRLDIDIRDGVATVTDVDQLTHDTVCLGLRIEEPADFVFKPGQYVDVHVPGDPQGARRSFSIANLPGDGRLELVIKCYPGGRFSGLLTGGGLAPGGELRFSGPYGSFHLRESERPVLCVAGGTGMGPVLALLRQLAQERSTRPVRFFYGARAIRDLFYVDVVHALGRELADFAFVPVLSDMEAGDSWDGERGFVHEAVARFLETGGLADYEAYTCGPPPLIEAASELLVDGHGLSEELLHFDKFTTAADAAEVAA